MIAQLNSQAQNECSFNFTIDDFNRAYRQRVKYSFGIICVKRMLSFFKKIDNSKSHNNRDQKIHLPTILK